MRRICPNEDVQISVAGPADLEAILALQKIAFLPEAARIDDYTIPPLMQDLDGIRDEFRTARFLKAEIGGHIVGSVRAELKGDTCLIMKLIVHPDYQDCGIGSQLLMSIEQSFPLAERFELFTGKKSERNNAFYMRRGYRPFKEVEVSEKLTLVTYEKMNGLR